MQPSPGLPEQVFIRDVGIGLKERLLLGHMRKEIRRNEVDVAQHFLEGKVKIAGRVNDGFLEGGDYVLLPDGTACCGIGRSNIEGVAALEKHLKRPVIKIPVKEEFVHLSGLISVVGDHVCVACLEALPKWFAEFLMKKFDMIEVGLEEEERLLYSACNVLSLDGEKVISFPQNCRVNEELKRRGFDVLEVEISEILKGGGGLTCLVLPLNQNAF
jgi:N-dimethylarginine dimethylaminohydrolase